jgi:hypothetical protein
MNVVLVIASNLCEDYTFWFVVSFAVGQAIEPVVRVTFLLYLSGTSDQGFLPYYTTPDPEPVIGFPSH